MPSVDAFRPVRCVDISQAGFAFYQENRPDCDSLVVELGIAPNLVYLTAHIMHFEMIEFCDNLVFRVGCEFTGRAEWGAQPESILRHCEVEDAFCFLEDHAREETGAGMGC